MAKKINNPYLIVINKDNKFNVDNYNGLKYVDVDVRQGDQGKNKSYIEKQTLQAYEQARLELQSIGGDCWINSAGRTEDDQKFAIEEKYNQIYMDKLKQAGLDQIPQNELSAEQQQLIMSLQQEARKETDDVTLPIGFSEHQCGLAIDIGVDMTKVKIPDNIKQNYPENTPQGFLNFSTRRLIMENHGFILRYPENARLREVTGVKKPEGWHWRYVEPEHSQIMAHIRERATNELNVLTEDGKVVTQEVFLEDYIKLLQYEITASSEDELLDKYVELFKTEILHLENENNQSLQ